MTRIESKKVRLMTTVEAAHEYLSNTDNLVQLLPSERISDWKSDGKSCSFKIQGAYTIGLVLQPQDNPNLVMYISAPGSPFAFTLNARLEAKDAHTEASQLCEAQLNPFLVMIVKEPLRNLFDYMADKLAARFSGD